MRRMTSCTCVCAHVGASRLKDWSAMPGEKQPVLRDNGMRLWALVADENANITSTDLSPSLRLRASVERRFDAALSSPPTSATSNLLPYQRQIKPTLDHAQRPRPLQPLPSSPSGSPLSPLEGRPPETPRRAALQELVRRKDSELNILRQELRREETLHRDTRCQLTSYQQLVHEFCVLQVRNHRHTHRSCHPRPNAPAEQSL